MCSGPTMVKTDIGEGLGGVTVQSKLFADKNTQVVVAEGKLERKVENGITTGESEFTGEITEKQSTVRLTRQRGTH